MSDTNGTRTSLSSGVTTTSRSWPGPNSSRSTIPSAAPCGVTAASPPDQIGRPELVIGKLSSGCRIHSQQLASQRFGRIAASKPLKENEQTLVPKRFGGYDHECAACVSFKGRPGDKAPEVIGIGKHSDFPI